ncbi:hypothetical protein PMIN06_003609 [Paraphaeosphaeria minitans]
MLRFVYLPTVPIAGSLTEEDRSCMAQESRLSEDYRIVSSRSGLGQGSREGHLLNAWQRLDENRRDSNEAPAVARPEGDVGDSAPSWQTITAAEHLPSSESGV